MASKPKGAPSPRSVPASQGVKGREDIRERRKPKTPMREKPGRQLIRLYQESGRALAAFSEGLSMEDRAALAEELDQGADYGELVERALPDKESFERIRKEFAKLERIRRKIADPDGLEQWAAHAIAEMCALFHLKRRIAERRDAGRLNTGPRASRYATEHPQWRAAARKQLCEHPDCEERQLVAAIRKKTTTKAASEAVRSWWRENEKVIRENEKVIRAGLKRA